MSVDCGLRGLSLPNLRGLVNDIEIVEHEDGCSLWSKGIFPPEEFLAAVAAWERNECGLDEDDLLGTDSWIVEQVEHVWMVENQFTGILRRCGEFAEGAEPYTYLRR